MQNDAFRQIVGTIKTHVIRQFVILDLRPPVGNDEPHIDFGLDRIDGLPGTLGSDREPRRLSQVHRDRIGLRIDQRAGCTEQESHVDTAQIDGPVKNNAYHPILPIERDLSVDIPRLDLNSRESVFYRREHRIHDRLPVNTGRYGSPFLLRQVHVDGIFQIRDEHLRSLDQVERHQHLAQIAVGIERHIDPFLLLVDRHVRIAVFDRHADDRLGYDLLLLFLLTGGEYQDECQQTCPIRAFQRHFHLVQRSLPETTGRAELGSKLKLFPDISDSTESNKKPVS